MTELPWLFGNQWIFGLFLAVVLLGLAEAGYRAGLRLYRTQDEPRRSQIGGIQGAVLGLLGLLLGFTFSMAVQRYEMRRDLVLKEATQRFKSWSDRKLPSFSPAPATNGVPPIRVEYKATEQANVCIAGPALSRND